MNSREKLLLRLFLALLGFIVLVIGISLWQDAVQTLRAKIQQKQKALSALTDNQEDRIKKVLQADIAALESQVYAKSEFVALEYGRLLREQAQSAGLSVTGIRLVKEESTGERWELALRGRPLAHYTFLTGLVAHKIPHAIYSYNLQKRERGELDAKVEIGYARHP